MLKRILGTVVVCLLPQICAAQDKSHWGIVGTATPLWKVPSQLEQLFDGTVDIKGQDVSIGIARGRSRGGDWGVSFIHKRLKDGSRVDNIEQDCDSFSNGCFADGESYTTRSVAINGLEVHKYIPFVTIKDRTQIGLNIAGGFGKWSGTVEHRQVFADFVSFNQATGRAVGVARETVTTEQARELLDLPVMPLFKLQVAGAVRVTPALKLRVEGGLDLPGYERIHIAAVYLIGAK